MRRSFVQVCCLLAPALVVLFAGAPLFLTGCSGNSYTLAGVGPAAGSDVTIEVEETDMGNKMVKIDVKHLPPANRVHEDASVFVVWFIAKGQPPQKVGRLQYDEDARAGKAGGTTSFENFTVLITAEENEAVSQPSKNVVVRHEDTE